MTTETRCIACNRPKGIPPRWKQILKKLGFYPNGLWTKYCTMAPIECEKCGSYSHFGCPIHNPHSIGGIF